MKVNIRSCHVALTDALRELVDRRIHFALSRFSPRISRVSVTIEDSHGLRAGTAQSCRIVIKLDRADEVRVDATDTDVKAAIALAADRASRVVQRELEWRRSGWRKAPSPGTAPDSPDEVVAKD